MKLLPNYYTFFGIENYSEFSLTDDQLNEHLMSLEKTGLWKDEYIITRVDAGIFVLTNPKLKRQYDFVLKHLLMSVFYNPFYVVNCVCKIGKFVTHRKIINNIKQVKEQCLWLGDN